MSGVTLAFYKGRGDWLDRVIRWVTRSPYSHVEIVALTGHATTAGHMQAEAVSASYRDGGVGQRRIDLNPDHWDLVTVPWTIPARVWGRALVEAGAGYDYAGLILSQLLHLRRGSGRRWFCSELVAHALDLPRPSSYSPGDLHDLVTMINDISAPLLMQPAPLSPPARPA